MGNNWDGSEDQYDESYDWDPENYLSGEMEFSGPDESDIEVAMGSGGDECTCPYDNDLYDSCGHDLACPACACEFKPCKDCDCESDHAHNQERCIECVCIVEPCESCDCELDHWDENEGCSCEESHSKQRTEQTSQGHVWNIGEDRQLISLYLRNLDLQLIATEMGMTLDLIRFRLLFLCFRAKGIAIRSTQGANSGKKWTSKEDFVLRLHYYAEATLQELSLIHQRSSLAIANRLIKLGLALPIDPEELHN